jgi:hypothetical protein
MGGRILTPFEKSVILAAITAVLFLIVRWFL